jgi:Icc-related predicted phosphoesterase
MAFRKFVNAAAFYRADVLVFGGDLMGKALAPIVRRNGRLLAEVDGRTHEFTGEDELRAFTRALEVNGFYWSVLDPDEHGAIRRDPLLAEGMVQDLARDRLRSWLAFAEDRLKGSGVRLFVTGGNDDPMSIERILESAGYAASAESRVLRVDDRHEMASTGYGNPTPWRCPRDIPEDELAMRIERMLLDVDDMEAALERVRETARGSDNLLPDLREALRVRCTIGEICNVLRDEFGLYDAQLPPA